MARKTGAEIIQILRNVTGRVDVSDPLFTDTIMLGRVNDFLSLIMPQEVRLYEKQTWWEFTIDETTLDPLPVDLETLGFSTLGSVAYVWVENSTTPSQINRFKLFWYQSPGVFYGKWPQVVGVQRQRPQDVLWYNNELTFRGPPDQEYTVQIQAYKIEAPLEAPSDEIDNSYFWRYVAYGAAIDLFNDYGEDDKTARVMPAFKRYKTIVEARTYQQLSTQRTYPTF